MAKTVFVNGSAVSPEFLNAINNPVFVDNPNYDGEIATLSNDALSGAPGQIKTEWTAFKTALGVTAGSGLTVSYAGGSVLLPNNAIAAISPGMLALADNATNFVYVNSAGTVERAAALPLMCLPLASAVTVAGQISGAVTDLRPRHRIFPRQNAIKIFGGSGDQGDYTLSSGSATFDQSEYYFRNFTIAEAATLTVFQAARIYCSGMVTIAGTIVIQAVAGTGGRGIQFASAASQAIISNNGFGFGGGGRVTGGGAYAYAVFPSGSGGAAGTALTTSGDIGVTATGGDGGGTLQIEAAGKITVSGTVQSRGANATVGAVTSGTPSIGGAGGGSGGMISLKSVEEVRVSGTLDVRGGNGSDIASGDASGGGGGGGGFCVIIAPAVNTTGITTNLAGGAAGAGAGASVTGGGGGGFGGAGGNQRLSGSSGLLVVRSFLPIG